MNAVAMISRCMERQQMALGEPDHGCGSRGAEATDTPALAPVQDEGIITDYRSLDIAIPVWAE